MHVYYDDSAWIIHRFSWTNNRTRTALTDYYRNAYCVRNEVTFEMIFPRFYTAYGVRGGGRPCQIKREAPEDVEKLPQEKRYINNNDIVRIKYRYLIIIIILSPIFFYEFHIKFTTITLYYNVGSYNFILLPYTVRRDVKISQNISM